MARSTRDSVFAELIPIARAHGTGVLRRAGLSAIAATSGGRVGLVLTGVVLTIAVILPFVGTVDPMALTGAPLAPPSVRHLMGTDALGRDLFSGVVHGARTSLLIATAVVLLALLCGLAIGMLAGYRGGIIDDLLMRFTEMFQVLPRFFLVVVAIALFGAGVDRVVLALGLTSWPLIARVVRGEIVAMRDLDFVRAAEAMGATRARIFIHQLLPNVLPSTLVLAGLLFGQVLLVEASLGFLGLGDPNTLSWGVLAGQALGFLRIAWWLPLFPGLAIAVAVLGVNLIADSASAAIARR